MLQSSSGAMLATAAAASSQGSGPLDVRVSPHAKDLDLRGFDLSMLVYLRLE